MTSPVDDNYCCWWSPDRLMVSRFSLVRHLWISLSGHLYKWDILLTLNKKSKSSFTGATLLKSDTVSSCWRCPLKKRVECNHEIPRAVPFSKRCHKMSISSDTSEINSVISQKNICNCKDTLDYVTAVPVLLDSLLV